VSGPKWYRSRTAISRTVRINDCRPGCRRQLASRHTPSGAAIAALITAAVNRPLARRKSLEDERARLRSTFAEASESVVRYKEIPYAIRRRRSDAPGAERVRLSEEMREIQAKLSYYLMWTPGESKSVGDAYATSVTNLRRVVGAACHNAWIAEPASNDAGMDIGPRRTAYRKSRSIWVSSLGCSS
jgi:hypothetical protein